MSKQFVKAKPLTEAKEKPPHNRQNRKVYNKKYEEKNNTLPRDSRDHIKQLLNAYKQMPPNPVILDLCAKYPKFFSDRSRAPEPENNQNFNDVLWLGPKKEYPKNIKQMSSDSSQPNWDSDEEKEVKLVSKKIDEKIVEKVTANISSKPQKKLLDLQRHEKQFLEDYYKQKLKAEHERAELAVKAPAPASIPPPQQKSQKPEPQPSQQLQQPSSQPEPALKKKEESEWAEYNPKVNALIDGGFIQKVNKDEEDDEDFSMEQDFSIEDEREGDPNNNKNASGSSSSDDDDDEMLTDEGPRTVTEKKSSTEGHSAANKGGIVRVSGHMFMQMTQQVGINPEACTWVISDKAVRYKVSTQYMDEMYISQGLCSMFPYISLNHSEFVHYQQIETEKALEKFKKFNQRKRYNPTNHQQTNNKSSKKPVQYKPRK